MVLDRLLRAGEGRILRKLKSLADQVDALESEFESMSDAELRAMTAEFRARLGVTIAADGTAEAPAPAAGKIAPDLEDAAEDDSADDSAGSAAEDDDAAPLTASGGKAETLDDLLPEAFATVREAAKRTLGQRHYHVQLMGGAALHLGNIAEMKTGEGKTLVSTLAAYLNALSGKGVHVVTVNDYLAQRDAESMGRVHRFLGLTVGVIHPSMSPDLRRPAYACDITYGTNNEFGFDYLRDNMAWSIEETVQRGHNFAVVDEVDSILIDEARTPLIISGPADNPTRWYLEFARIAPLLKRDEHYEVEEGKRTVAITEEGVEMVEDQLGIENLYESVNTPLVGYLNNALKAKELYKKDKDYIVSSGEVLIVDEFTGRVLQGRRYSEGMHQAIEAKEGVEIKQENQTLATITLQNYFRLYDKLSGMTGTAMTEAAEFSQIYKLGVVPIPTNKPMVRDDAADVVYKTEPAKFDALVEDIAERHENGQPVLIGTTSVAKSEYLSQLLTKRGVKHEVLNAKQHDREAAIIAQAGRLGAVTVATNMAGRGTDIMLGGNPDFLADLELRQRGLSPLETPEDYEAAWSSALEKKKGEVADEHEKVVEAGGLYVLGTERHESRRIDNQLRGRSGRQGDPGLSRFYLSLGDDLMRLFNATMVESIMNRLNIPDDVPIESKMVTRAIRSAQTQVEGQNFEIRKNVLKYDEVMNKQRTVIYAERRRVLEGEDLHEQVRHFLRDTIEGYVRGATAEGYPEEWDLDQLWSALGTLYPVGVEVPGVDDRSGLTSEGLLEDLIEDALDAYQRREDSLGVDSNGTPVLRELERRVVLSVLDRKWREHLYEMDYLQEGIGLRAMGQRDPVVEYQREGFDMFASAMDGIKEESVGFLFNLEVQVEQQAGQPEAEPIHAWAGGGTAEVDAPDGGTADAPGSNGTGTAAGTSGSDTSGSGTNGSGTSGSGTNGSGTNGSARTGSGPNGAGAAKPRSNGGGGTGAVPLAKGLDGGSRPRLQYSAPAVDGDSSGGAVTTAGPQTDLGDGVLDATGGEPSRNAPCPCGSGRKYKRCHGDPTRRTKA